VEVEQLELVLELLELAGHALRGVEDLAVQLARRVLGQRERGVAGLEQLARAAHVPHGGGQVAVGLAEHLGEHEVAEDRVAILLEQRIHLAPRGDELAVRVERVDLLLALARRVRPRGTAVEAGQALVAAARSRCELAKREDRDDDHPWRPRPAALAASRAPAHARDSPSSGCTQHCRTTSSMGSEPGASARRWPNTSGASAQTSSAPT
jgi:hypothetical protein